MSHRMVVPGFSAACLTVAASVLISVVLLQYSARRTGRSRLLLAGLPVLLLLVVAGVPAKTLIEHIFPAAPQTQMYRLSFDPNPNRQQPGSGQALVVGGDVWLSLPVESSGFPSGVSLKGRGVAIDVDTPEGFHWSSHYQEISTDFSGDNPHSVLEVLMPLGLYNRIRDTPVNLSVSIAAVRYQATTLPKFQVEAPRFLSPGRGVCPILADGLAASCLYPLRMPPPIVVMAEVFDRPCLDTVPATVHAVQSFVASDDDYLSYDFDPVTTSQLQLLLPPDRTGLNHPGYLCPGARLTLTPRVVAGREMVKFTQSGVLLAPYARHVLSPSAAPAKQAGQS